MRFKSRTSTALIPELSLKKEETQEGSIEAEFYRSGRSGRRGEGEEGGGEIVIRALLILTQIAENMRGGRAKGGRKGVHYAAR